MSHNIDDILEEFSDQTTKTTSLSQELTHAMLNERMSPDLLPYKKQLLDEVLKQISNQQQYLLDSHEYGDMNVDSGMISGDFKLQLMIIETDIERLSYLVRLYFRTRLEKIDNFTIFYIGENSKNESLVSPEEQEYMENHFQILTKLYNNSFLKKLPEFLTYLDDTAGNQSMVTRPDVAVPVFIKVKSRSPILISLGHDEELELVKDGVYVVRYELVKLYIELGDIELI